MSKADTGTAGSLIAEFAARRQEGLLDQALELGTLLLGEHRSEIETHTPEGVSLLCDLAEVHAEAGDLERAEALLREAAELAQHLKTDELALRAVAGLALLFDQTARNADARTFYERAIKIAERMPEPNKRQIAVFTNNLAILYKDLGTYEQAEAAYLKAIQLYKDLHKQSHPDVAAAMNNLGVFYLQRGDLQNAEALHIKALIMRQKECHPSDPDVAQSYSNLAAVYHMRGWLDKAESFYQKALVALNHSKNPPPDERETMIRNYVALLRMLGNDALADKLESRL